MLLLEEFRLIEMQLTLKKKRKADGEIERNNARLVAQGFIHTISSSNLCVIYDMLVLLRFVIDNMDVNMAFLNTSLLHNAHINILLGYRINSWIGFQVEQSALKS